MATTLADRRAAFLAEIGARYNHLTGFDTDTKKFGAAPGTLVDYVELARWISEEGQKMGLSSRWKNACGEAINVIETFNAEIPTDLPFGAISPGMLQFSAETAKWAVLQYGIIFLAHAA